MIREYLRTLTVATLALSVLAAPGVTSYAKIEHPPDDGVRCAYFNNKTGQWLFYMPGETIAILDENGHPTYLRCGYDGNWIQAKPDRTPSNGSGGPRGTYGGP